MGLDRRPAWRAKPYCLDLRDRAVARGVAGETVRSVAATLLVGVARGVNRRSWLQKWSPRFRATGGALIVHESIFDDERRRNAFGLLISLNMLIETAGGFDFTGADCQAWMREAGFSQTRVEPLTGPDSMVIAIK